MIKKTLLLLTMFATMLYPTLTNDTQFALMFSARQVDIVEYFKATGVVIQDTPLMNPFFTGLRVDQCFKRVWYFESTKVILPCFATMADKVSWQQYSHMRQTLRGINQYNSGDRTGGKMLINANIAEYVPLKED